MSYDSHDKRSSGHDENRFSMIKNDHFSKDIPSGKDDAGKYKCRRSVKHIRLNIVDSHVGQNSPEWTASTCDPLGSYTGIPENKFEKPVQDADDL